MTIDQKRQSDGEVRVERDRIVAEAARLMQGGDVEDARAVLSALELGTIDGKTLAATDRWLRQMAGSKRIVASFDPSRRPAMGEVVIIYGNYPHFFANLVVNNPIRRPVNDFWRFQHDVIEADDRWAGVDRIYVINLDGRPDRYDAVLRELAGARAPLDRVTRISASRPRPGDLDWLGGHLGCTRSHIEAMASAIEHQARHVLILEDDFSFTSDLDQHLDDLSAFIGRDYDYWVCLVATSKYGQLLPKDDLVNISFQECTTTGGYLLSAAGAQRMLPYFRESHDMLARTGKHAYAADRCWAVLQPSGKILVFKRKLGYQASSFSDIESEISRNMD